MAHVVAHRVVRQRRWNPHRHRRELRACRYAVGYPVVYLPFSYWLSVAWRKARWLVLVAALVVVTAAGFG